jgi:hypothetical protein
MWRNLSLFRLWIVGLVLLALAQPAQAQKPLLYLCVATPAGPLLANFSKDFSSVVAPLQQKLQSNGYHVVTHPDTLRQLLKQPAAPRFLYADVVCYQWAGSFPTVVFAVRDSLNKPWFTASESTTMFISQQKALSTAARHLAERLPTTFTARFGTEKPVDRGPQFIAYDNFQFTNYLETVLYTAPLRQQLKQGAALKLTLHIDELGLASLKSVGDQFTLDTATQLALETAIRNTPPWGPAYQNGRRTAVDFQTTIERVKPVR